jgi:hypothetical protein
MSSLITILDIWNTSDEKIPQFMQLLIRKNFEIFQHDDPHVSLLLTLSNSLSLNERELNILKNTTFRNKLINSTLNHEEKIVDALFSCEPTISMENIIDLESEIFKNPHTNILEMTRGYPVELVCQNNEHNENGFIDEVTGKILDSHSLFHMNGHCYNVDDLYDYIHHGGHVDLTEDFITKYFNSIINYEGLELTDEQLEHITFHHEANMINLSNNKLTNIDMLEIPDNIKAVNLSYNNLQNVRIKSNSLKLLDLSSNPMEDISNGLPLTLEMLTLNKCSELKSIRLDYLDHLKSITLSDCKISNLSSLFLGQNIKVINIRSFPILDVLHIVNSNVKHLKIEDCNNFTLLVDNCDNLKTIELKQCGNIGDFSIQSCHKLIIKNSPLENIKHINVANINEVDLIDNLELKDFDFTKFTNLMKIKIVNCPKLLQLKRKQFPLAMKNITVENDNRIQMQPTNFFKSTF